MRDKTENLKVVFLGFGLAHYFNDLLNRLQEKGNLEIVVVKPTDTSEHIGAGVYQTDGNVAFRVVELHEEIREAPVSYPRIEFCHFQKPTYYSFPELETFLRKERPNIVIVSADHFDLFYYDAEVRVAIQEIDTKVVFRSIPFQTEEYGDALARVRDRARLPLASLPTWLHAVIRASGLPSLYSRFVRQRTLTATVEARRRIFLAPDAHVCYFPHGIETYGGYGFPRERIFVTLNSTDTDSLFACRNRLETEERVKRDPYRLIHVGRLVEWKRVDLLLQAVAALRPRFPKISAVIVGKGPKETELRQLAIDLKINDAITFTGGIYDPLELGRQFMQAGIYVLAGMGGLSINEAMCFELPVVCSVCDGTEKVLVRNGVTGIIFQEGDLDSLCSSIDRLLASPAKSESMGQAGRRLIREHVNFDIITGRYIAMFHHILGIQYTRPDETIAPWQGSRETNDCEIRNNVAPAGRR